MKKHVSTGTSRKYSSTHPYNAVMVPLQTGCQSMPFMLPQIQERISWHPLPRPGISGALDMRSSFHACLKGFLDSLSVY